MDKQHKEIARFYNDVYYKDADPGRRTSKHLTRLADRLNIASWISHAVQGTG